VRQVRREKETQLREDRSAQRQQPFLLALAEHPEPSALSVEVADLDPGQLAAAHAQHQQTEQAETVARVRGSGQQPGTSVQREDTGNAPLRAGPADLRRGLDRDVSLLFRPCPERPGSRW